MLAYEPKSLSLQKKISLLLTRKGFMRMLVIENLYMSFPLY